MDVYEAIKMRRSVRAYRITPVSEESLRKILDAARMAPSLHNSQEYKFIVVKNSQKIEEISKAAFGQKFIAEAPMVIAGVSLNPSHIMENNVPAYAVDLAIALDHITLAAVEEGLGTCWITVFSQEEVKRILGVPDEYKIVALLTIGTPYDDPSIKSRKKLGQLVCYDNFSE
jgi:nitroreductase